jgi:CRP-like cAMP-binding protein
LASLSPQDHDALSPHLKDIVLPQGMVLYRAGDEIERIYFPHTGIVSFVVVLLSGEAVEAGMFGKNSLVGTSAALDGPVALNQAVIQSAGTGSYVETSIFKRLAADSASLRTQVARHEQMMIAHTQQVAACNAKHGLEERLCRWLLQARDLMGSDDLRVTQEFLAEMLGVTRSSVTLVARRLAQTGLISYSRGRVKLLDLEGIRDVCCECYGTINAHFRRLAGWENDKS